MYKIKNSNKKTRPWNYLPETCNKSLVAVGIFTDRESQLGANGDLLYFKILNALPSKRFEVLNGLSIIITGEILVQKVFERDLSCDSICKTFGKCIKFTGF